MSQNILVASIFRNSVGYLDRYFKQVGLLKEELKQRGDRICLTLLEGDSSDETLPLLNSWMQTLAQSISQDGMCSMFDEPCHLLKVDHGGPVFGSVDNDTRWRNISFVCNELLQSITAQEGIDKVLYVESDLIWSSTTMVALLDDLDVEGRDAVATMCFHRPTGLFYDTWGHRSGGVRFAQYPPYHALLADQRATHIPMDSAGSCIAMKWKVARDCRFRPPELGIVGFGLDMRAHGYNLWLNRNAAVLHP